MKRVAIASIIAAALAVPALADDAHHKKGSDSAQGATQSSTMAEGEVRRVDKDAKKLTIRHGPIANLDMPGMTMVFQVRDPAMLEQVKTGDKIRFSADKVDGAYTVTHIEPVK